jgi:hypothetical protein
LGCLKVQPRVSSGRCAGMAPHPTLIEVSAGRLLATLLPGRIRAEQREGAGVRAHVGDELVLDGNESRAALIIGLQGPDGPPPCVVRWLGDGHISLVYPGPPARVRHTGTGESRRPR